jgi:ADP-ribosylglycohydrolase
MRAPILGVCLGHDPDHMRAYLRASTRLTHTDPRAERGALLVAQAAYHGASRGPAGVNAAEFLDEFARPLAKEDAELAKIFGNLESHLSRDESPADFARSLGLDRVSGYMYHTVPIVLACWLRWPGDYRRAVEAVIRLGGDTDTTGAIAGALAGATGGVGAIPAEWLAGVRDWPRSVEFLKRVAARLAGRMGGDCPRGAVPWFWPAQPGRNLFFLAVVLAHLCRRLLPW